MNGILIIISILLALQMVIGESQVAKEYVLHPDKVDIYFKQAALMAILKAKAKRLLKAHLVETVDEVLYLRCAAEAKTPVILAQCLVKLMKARDSKLEQSKTLQNDPWQTDWFEELRKLFWPSNSNNKRPEVNLTRKTERQIRRLPIKRVSDIPLSRPDLFSRRNKRRIDDFYQISGYPNIQNLRKIESFFAKSDFCRQYYSRLQNNNERYLHRFTKNVKYDVKTEADFVGQITAELDKIFSSAKFGKLSIASPKILSLLPDHGKRPNLLSPSLLSFHNNGLFSMPELLKYAASDDREVLNWLEFLMEVSGAGKQLKQLLTAIEGETTKVNKELYPKISQIQRWEKEWSRVVNRQNRRQKKELGEYGYTFLNEQQARRMFNGDKIPEYIQLSASEQEFRLEQKIREIANLADVKRKRRATTPTEQAAEPTSNSTTREGGGNRPPHFAENYHALALEPFVFVNQLNENIILEGLILSPHAFLSELLVSKLLPYDILTPRAFISSILSAQVLVARVLSPAAFRSEVLSFTGLNAMILSPEALLAYIISPRILEARIGSPEALTILVLSPGILNPRIYSGDYYSILVLSPHILSPRFESPEQMVVEILSPHILGGSHETEDEGAMHHAEDVAHGGEIHQNPNHGANDDGQHIERPGESIVGAPH